MMRYRVVVNVHASTHFIHLELNNFEVFWCLGLSNWTICSLFSTF